ncbi:16656_t:CDS:2 [Entrophospora sp. SA101]|nr:16656_t:CDS:2 [Entrophospora sp. SA101]
MTFNYQQHQSQDATPSKSVSTKLWSANSASSKLRPSTNSKLWTV